MLNNKGSRKVNWHDEEMLRLLVKNSINQSEVLQKLGLNVQSSAVTFRKYIKLYGIDISHFNTYRIRNGTTKMPLSEILVENSDYKSRHCLKLRLIKEKVLEYKCGICGNPGSWQNQPLSLQLEHLNGISNDNRIENLMFLCPNCHSQTDTFAGKNKKQNMAQ